ncbi:hypothetical protein [Chryseolinea lacunae]|uniref:ATP-binding protein n=1 Tax=Chryseolinea lacunae TaxID=2801331 RepID=A0ABS1KP06_9BACT|nr:hypothetical protein [Chryseolinea lacunae]MBL0741079.1 hypothetical protein [Chryseolinea lacunae]
MNFNWHSIISLNNSQQEGFEELVCQIASQQNIQGAAGFRRVGKPDGGKECYWELTTGEFIAWQAKFFTNSPSPGQWKQIEKSVTECIRNHETIKRIIVTLPFDLPDVKVAGAKSALEKWKEKSAKWKAFAKARKQKVDFVYWGSTELLSFLAANGNEGLKQFFFNSKEYSDEWFDTKNRESQTALGSRYTKEFSIDLPIAGVFSALARDATFQSKVYDEYEAYLKRYRDVQVNDSKEEVTTQWRQLETTNHEFRVFFESIPWTSNEPIPFDAIQKFLEKLLTISKALLRLFYVLQAAETKDDKAGHEYYDRPYASELTTLRQLISGIEKFQYYFEGPLLALANNPFLLVNGDAGTGKSHLLADVVNSRKEHGLISLHLLGENFSSKDLPWTQILQNHVRKSTIDEFTFLGALNAKGQAKQSRIIIFIDAINEGEGRVVWPNRLSPFIESIKEYSWIGLVLSVRTSFVPLIASREDLDDHIITRVEHHGFKGLEHQAAATFFDHYSIELPDTPILNPEFQNPLFLKLFCESLKKRGLRKIPEGYEGLTSIFQGFLESVDKRLAQPSALFYDEQKKLVIKAVKGVVGKLADKKEDYLDYDQANSLVDSIFDGQCAHPEPYLRRLISEGVFNEDLRWNGEPSYKAVISFSYQRFQDHLIVENILEKELGQGDPKMSFQKGTLREILQNEENAYFNMNLLEALSVQLPERVGKELYEVAPHAKHFPPVADAFINALLWRKSTSFTDASKDFVAQVIFKKKKLLHAFLNVSISLSARPTYFFNADSIHNMLMGLTLPKRDKFWTTFIHDEFGNGVRSSSITTLIRWAWTTDDKSHLSESSMRLSLTMIAWLLTSSNRRLRDSATKALVCLLQQRLNLAVYLIEQFNEVNDPYVKERIFASVYGAVVRSNSDAHLLEIANTVQQLIFSGAEVYPHILARDYARGVVEFAAFIGIALPFNIATVRPPYKSAPLPEKLPTKAEIEAAYRPKGNSGNYGQDNWGVTAILASMNPGPGQGEGYGDFGHYVFASALRNFKVNRNGLSWYGVQRVIEMGYDADNFTKFDLLQGSGRGNERGERIGKKYQWMVFHEILARVADTHELKDESNFEDQNTIRYDGPWYPRVRDIDPTVIISETGSRKRRPGITEWWKIPEYSNFALSAEEWLGKANDLPSIPKIVDLVDDKGTSWVYLEIHPEWTENEKLGEDKWSHPRKRLWYQVRSIIINKGQLNSFHENFSDMFYSGAFPEARSLYDVFSREYYWSDAFDFFNKRFYSGGDWVGVYKNDRMRKKIGDGVRTTERFNWEEEFDKSKESAISFYKPTAFLFENLGMKFSPNEGEFVDKNGALVCFDPSVNNPAIAGLVVRKDILMEYLDRNNLCLLWSIVGEKQIIGNYRGGDYSGRLNISGLFELKSGEVTGKLKGEREGADREIVIRFNPKIVRKSSVIEKQSTTNAIEKLKARKSTLKKKIAKKKVAPTKHARNSVTKKIGKKRKK